MRSLGYIAILLGLSATLLWGCNQEQPQPVQTPAPPVSQTPTASAKPTQPAPTRSGSDVYTHQSLATGSPQMNRYVVSPPGQSTVKERSYEGAPPVIPHSIAGQSINKDSNSCLSCHSSGLQLSAGHIATKISDSHYTDLQTGQKGTAIVGTRYYCLSCHVTQTDR